MIGVAMIQWLSLAAVSATAPFMVVLVVIVVVMRRRHRLLPLVFLLLVTDAVVMHQMWSSLWNVQSRTLYPIL
jgi:hypothetical protein